MIKPLLVSVAVLLAACSGSGSGARQSSPTPSEAVSGAVEVDYNTCHYVHPVEAQGLPNAPLLVLPDPHCTPGAFNQGVTQEQACGGKESPRPDLRQLKLKTMVRYGLAPNVQAAANLAGQYEGDHFGMRWAGGLDTEANYWPEPGATPNPKDGLEFKLYDLVCKSQSYPGGLAQARHDILNNWVKLWIDLGKPSVRATEALA